MEQALAINDLRNKVPAAAFHRSMPRYRCPSCCCGPAMVSTPPEGNHSGLFQLRVTLAASTPGSADSSSGADHCRSGVLVASSIPILFTPASQLLSIQALKSWLKCSVFASMTSVIGAFMTLGRFLIFFVIGLVLAITGSPVELAALASRCFSTPGCRATDPLLRFRCVQDRTGVQDIQQASTEKVRTSWASRPTAEVIATQAS